MTSISLPLLNSTQHFLIIFDVNIVLLSAVNSTWCHSPYHITGRNSCVQFWLLQCTSLLFLASDLIGFTGYTHALLIPQLLFFHLSSWTCRFADYSKMFWPWKVMLTFPENVLKMETMVKKSLNVEMITQYMPKWTWKESCGSWTDRWGANDASKEAKSEQQSHWF